MDTHEQRQQQQVGDTLIRAGCALTATVAFAFLALIAVVWVLAALR